MESVWVVAEGQVESLQSGEQERGGGIGERGGGRGGRGEEVVSFQQLFISILSAWRGGGLVRIGPLNFKFDRGASPILL